MNKFNNIKKYSGFTLIELLVVIGIITIATGAVTLIIVTGYKQYRVNSIRLLLQSEAQTAINKMVRELREATEFTAIEPNQIVFYTDIKDTSTPEKIRYFVDNNNIKRGLTEPVGDPVTYPQANEIITIITSNLRPTQNNIFSYYDSQYPPQSTTSLTAITLVKIDFSLDTDINLDPNAYQISTEVNIRNKKINF